MKQAIQAIERLRQLLRRHPAQQLRQLLQRHPRRLMAGFGALLLGTGVTAVAVAPLSADGTDPPQREVVESVGHLPQPARTQAGTPFVLFRSDLTRRSDSVPSLLRRLGVNDSRASAFLRSDASARTLLVGEAGKLVSVETDERHRLLRLTARWLPEADSDWFSRLVIEPGTDGALCSRLELAPLQRSVRLSSGVIRSNLFAAMEDARLPDDIAEQLAELFANEIDFRRDLKRGDRFHVSYETLEADGEVLRFGQLLGAEFVNGGKKHQLMWFQEPGREGAFYTLDGQSLKRAFLASPVAFSRVSSGYGMRFHPISGREKPHLGIDFAAPTGTAVRSVGDGKVGYAGWRNGYGNFIVIEHRDQQSTAYAHLSRINVRQGQLVRQGDLIGAVGSTGASTGPHLHFEYLVRNQHQDPLTLARARASQPISTAARAEFKRLAQSMREQLAAAATVVQASAQ
jgi:murein DD-endopeptidase MepM/ murein hydrolase activator NlpD